MKSDDANRNNLADSIEVADFHIQNNGTLEELHAKIEVILHNLD